MVSYGCLKIHAVVSLFMILFPNAKINIGLNITERRSDGYHNLETIFYPIKINDALEVIESDKLSFESSGLDIPGRMEDLEGGPGTFLLFNEFGQCVLLMCSVSLSLIGMSISITDRDSR